jgi:hypothetical protein
MTELRPVSFKKGREHAPRLSPIRRPGRTDARFWTEAENNILRRYFPDGGMPAVGAHLPNRSRSSIYAQANKLGLSRNGVQARAPRIETSPEMDDRIRARWPELSGRGAVAAFADELEVPRWWLSDRAQKMGLIVAHKKEPNWTTAEEDLIRKVPLHNLDRCAAIFREHGFQRSPTSIAVKAKRLSLSRRATRTTFSGTGAARLLGMDNKTVTAWCVAGDLKASRRGSKRLPQQGGDAWEIEPHDLRQFIMDNLARFDIRKVSKVEFCELLARCPKCGKD